MRRARVERWENVFGREVFSVVDDLGNRISDHHDEEWAMATAETETLKLNNPK